MTFLWKIALQQGPLNLHTLVIYEILKYLRSVFPLSLKRESRILYLNSSLIVFEQSIKGRSDSHNINCHIALAILSFLLIGSLEFSHLTDDLVIILHLMHHFDELWVHFLFFSLQLFLISVVFVPVCNNYRRDHDSKRYEEISHCQNKKKDASKRDPNGQINEWILLKDKTSVSQKPLQIRIGDQQTLVHEHGNTHRDPVKEHK